MPLEEEKLTLCALSVTFLKNLYIPFLILDCTIFARENFPQFSRKKKFS
jgi:hypothetical protein